MQIASDGVFGPTRDRDEALRVLRAAVAAGRPLSDRSRTVVPGCGARAHRQRQHVLQRMPAARSRTRVRDTGQPSAQAAPRRVISGNSPGQLTRRDVIQYLTDIRVTRPYFDATPAPPTARSKPNWPATPFSGSSLNRRSG
jgi:hypothetical protein